MNWHTQDDYPDRGKPRTTVNWTVNHEYVLRAADKLQRDGALITDQAIYDLIVKARGKVISESGARTRRGELIDTFKFLTKSSVKSRTESGRACSTYRVTDAGQHKAKELRDASAQMRLEATA